MKMKEKADFFFAFCVLSCFLLFFYSFRKVSQLHWRELGKRFHASYHFF